MLLTTFIFAAVCFLGYSNGANDNFKGVASLFGSRTCGYRPAIIWATVMTFAGSIAAVFVAEGLLRKFSGHGLVPEALAGSPRFMLAVALGAGATVILAAFLGFPISTTHSLAGALVGAGIMAVGTRVNPAVLGKSFVVPLLFSPVLAMVVGALIYFLFHFLRLRLALTREMCVCFGVEGQLVPLFQADGTFSAKALPTPSLSVDAPAACVERYTGTVFGMNAGRLLDSMHFLSAGAVSFARGLNDTPKIAALLMVSGMPPRAVTDLTIVALSIALGGLLSARKVADTMSHKITGMNPGQGFAANLATALLVTTASLHGLPVSTTHVSVGSLLGMGLATRQARWKPVIGVIASWVITLPCSVILSALFYRVSAAL